MNDEYSSFYSVFEKDVTMIEYGCRGDFYDITEILHRDAKHVVFSTLLATGLTVGIWLEDNIACFGFLTLHASVAGLEKTSISNPFHMLSCITCELNRFDV